MNEHFFKNLHSFKCTWVRLGGCHLSMHSILAKDQLTFFRCVAVRTHLKVYSGPRGLEFDRFNSWIVCLGYFVTSLLIICIVYIFSAFNISIKLDLQSSQQTVLIAETLLHLYNTNITFFNCLQYCVKVPSLHQSAPNRPILKCIFRNYWQLAPKSMIPRTVPMQ